MKDPTPQSPEEPGQRSRSGVDRTTGRHVIARLVGTEHDTTVQAVVDQLSGEQSTVESIVEDALGEPERLKILEQIGRYDDARSPALDSVATLTAEALGTKAAAVTLVYPNRQVSAGLSAGASEVPQVSPLKISISKYTVASREALVVDDTHLHPLLRDHPDIRAAGVRAYAGVPLIDAHGIVVATLCTWDTRPRHWSSGQVQILNDLADVALRHLLAELA